MKRALVWAGAGAVLALSFGVRALDRRPRSFPVGEHPAPTEIAADQDEEQAHEGRDAWIERMHRAPPGVAWRWVEGGNVRDLIAARRSPLRSAPVGQWVERGSDNQAGS